MLHILTQDKLDALSYCQQAVDKNDMIILIADGVYLILQEEFNNLLESVRLNNTYALKDDIIARGLNGIIPKYIQLIDYSKFVEITEIYPSSQSW